MKRHTEVIVFKQEKHAGDWPPVGASDFLEWFAEKINLIPEDFRSSATIVIDKDRNYNGEYETTLLIAYFREETAGETQKREECADYKLAKELEYHRDALRKLSEK